MKLTKKISICAMLASLGIVILYIGSFFEILDMSVACIASVIIMFCVAELGYAASFAVYAVISVISLMILPAKWTAIYFIFFFGIMPITKKLLEKLGKIFSWVLKFLLFNAELTAFYFVASALDFFEQNEFSAWLFIVFFVMANIVFLIMDILYGRLYILYEIKYRPRIKKFLK
ncbi:MAG: hypothetical protein ACI4QR_04925 [Eubacteriales bacterium]